MSFFKKIKDKLTPPKANVSLKFNKSNFVLGENVEGDLVASSDEEFDTTEIRCEIHCVEEAKKMERTYDEGLRREVEREVWESAILLTSVLILCRTTFKTTTERGKREYMRKYIDYLDILRHRYRKRSTKKSI